MSAQRGSGLLELMLAVSLSLMLVLSAIVLLHAANAGFIWQEQSALMQDSAAVATESIARALRQTAYIDYAQVPGDRSRLPVDGLVWGADASSPASTQADSRAISATSIRGSDLLAVRFAGSGNVADGGVINCAGFAVPRAQSLSADRGISIFYVAASGTGQTELRCKYRGSQQWDSQALIAGVESFQVLYEIDTDGDGMTDQTVNARPLPCATRRITRPFHYGRGLWRFTLRFYCKDSAASSTKQCQRALTCLVLRTRRRTAVMIGAHAFF
jgi:type IV pilus assembly protein PilW